MGSKMSAEYYRAYRIAHRERINHQERERRKNNPAYRLARVRSEIERRKRRRAEEAAKVVISSHPMLDEATKIAPKLHPGTNYKFTGELDIEDARTEAIIAMLEGRDPHLAAKQSIRKDRDWVNHLVSIDKEKEEYVTYGI